MVTKRALVANEVFRVVADPTRRAILDLLRGGAQSAGRIAGAFRVSRPAVSKHLRLLRNAHLVLISESKDGRSRVYKLNPRPLTEVDRWLSRYRQFWHQSLFRLKEFAEARERKGKN